MVSSVNTKKEKKKEMAANNPFSVLTKIYLSSLLRALLGCNKLQDQHFRYLLLTVLGEATMLFRILPSQGYLFTIHRIHCLHI